MYLEQEGKRYDASLWLTPEGTCAGVAKMVHIMQAAQFYERDYYTPSEDGFLVFDTPARPHRHRDLLRPAPAGEHPHVRAQGRGSCHHPDGEHEERTHGASSSGKSACRRCRTRSSSPCATAWGARTGWTLPVSRSSCTRAATCSVRPTTVSRLIVQELDLAEARLWRERKRRISGSGGRNAICKQSEPRTGCLVRDSLFAVFIYTPGTDSVACPDSCVRTRWR